MQHDDAWSWSWHYHKCRLAKSTWRPNFKKSGQRTGNQSGSISQPKRHPAPQTLAPAQADGTQLPFPVASACRLAAARAVGAPLVAPTCCYLLLLLPPPLSAVAAGAAGRESMSALPQGGRSPSPDEVRRWRGARGFGLAVVGRVELSSVASQTSMHRGPMAVAVAKRGRGGGAASACHCASLAAAL